MPSASGNPWEQDLGRRVLARHFRQSGRADGTLRDVLDQAVGGLDEPFRSSVIYCDVEGRTPREAAALLGWERRKVKTGLRSGRRLLRAELRRRGVFLPGKALVRWLRPGSGMLLPPDANPSCVTTVSLRAQQLAGWVLSWL